jgi:hypothetical protein
MKHGITLTLMLVAASSLSASAAHASVFDDVFGHYEAIRQALIADSTEGIEAHAHAISSAAAGLAGNFSATAAAVNDSDAETVKSLLPEIQKRAGDVAAAADLKDVRQEMAMLTQPLVRWHRLVEGSRPVVVYCPMERKAWLQPDEPVGNPYDPSMLRCGEVVQR